MCVTSGKIKLELYVTPEELILIGEVLKDKVGKIVLKTLDDDGEDRPKQKPPNE
jgi:hypothetical protein